MKRLTLALLPVLVIGLSSSISNAQHRRGRAPAPDEEGKVFVKCPHPLRNIKDCPNTGCGKPLDPNLNKVKNVRTSNKTPVDKDFSYLHDLDDPVADFAIGDERDKPRELGEGTMIRIAAYALAARHGSPESCNCGLGQPADTDNHIVLVDEETLKLKAKATPGRKATPRHKAVKPVSAKTNTLHLREKQSQTAEFTPRVRLDHPKLAGARLQALIDNAPDNALLVRVTGLQMFDSEHSLGKNKLTRHNNWEIHPVFKLEYCPNGKTCTANSNKNWVDLER
jgi:hypothetical protein